MRRYPAAKFNKMLDGNMIVALHGIEQNFFCSVWAPIKLCSIEMPSHLAQNKANEQCDNAHSRNLSHLILATNRVDNLCIFITY